MLPEGRQRHGATPGTDAAVRLLQGLHTIATRRPRPRPFTDVGSLPWDDAAFSRHFLRTATRSRHYTRREIAFLERCGLLVPGRRILDLACGGGRHSLAMAQRGARVTGIDLGPAAIATARRRARRAGVAVEFLQGDIRCLDYTAAFDAVTCIFGCLTEMPRTEAQEVFRRVSRCLRPGGMFLLDVYSPRFFAALDGLQEWWVGRDFIAGRFAQLVLTEYFYYAREKTYVRRDFICNPATGDVHSFHVSGQAYTLPDLCRMLTGAGLSPVLTAGGWQGEPVLPESPFYVVLAAKDVASPST
jgi:SAM-dependent methyltransferase